MDSRLITDACGGANITVVRQVEPNTRGGQQNIRSFLMRNKQPPYFGVIVGENLLPVFLLYYSSWIQRASNKSVSLMCPREEGLDQRVND